MSRLNTLIEQLKSNTFPEKESYRLYRARTFSESFPIFLLIYLGLSDLLLFPFFAFYLTDLWGNEYSYNINKNGDNKDFLKRMTCLTEFTSRHLGLYALLLILAIFGFIRIMAPSFFESIFKEVTLINMLAASLCIIIWQLIRYWYIGKQLRKIAY